MNTIDHQAPSPESHEDAKHPMRVIATLAATALTAGLAVGAAEGYKAYQDLQHPHYSIDLDEIVGGSER